MRMKHWLIALDQFLLCTVTLGGTNPDWTLSAYAYEWEKEGKWYGFLRPLIDFLFSGIEKDHCKKSYENELR